jgi:hypothetical protein
MRAYSMDLRVRVLADSDEGMGATAVAAKYRSVDRGSGGSSRGGRRPARPPHGPRAGDRRPATWAPHAEAIRAAVRDDPDATLAELKQRLGLAPSLTTPWRAVAAPGLTVEKKSSGRRNGTAPTSRRSGRHGGPASPPSIRRG